MRGGRKHQRDNRPRFVREGGSCMTTSSYNPILGREDLPPWWMFWLRPQLKPGVAMVLMQKGLPAKALRENDSAKWSLIAWHNYQTVFWVDVNQQTLAFQCKLPTRTPGIEFQAEVYVTYQVNQPIEIVRRRITDVRTVVEPRLVRLLREASLQYVADQCTAAEKKINEEAERNITNHNLRQGDIAIKGYFVTLDMEEEERTHAQRMRFIDRNNAYAVLNTWYNGHIDLLDAVRARNQINLYKDIIQTGDSNLLLLYLANHREEIQPVLGALNQQRDRERDHWKRMFEILSKA